MKSVKRSLRSTLVCAGIVMGGGAAFADAPTFNPLPDPIPGTIPFGRVTVELETIASGFTSPVAAAVAPGHPGTLFVADQIGDIWAVDVREDAGPGDRKQLFTTMRSQLIPLGVGPIEYDERGLLGLAFHPDFLDNGLLYTYMSVPVSRTVDFSTMSPGVAPNCQNVLMEWRVTNPRAATLTFDPSYGRELFRIDKPELNHNGGGLHFGPDGLLYLSLGDGGAADDYDNFQGHVPGGNAQSLTPGNLLGKIIRIDPLGHDSHNGQYGIPADNPQLGAGAEREIYAYGLRNPWRMSFDRGTGKLYVGDVGQNDIEEIDIITKGGNYGWPIKEGTFMFANRTLCSRPSPSDPNNQGCAYEDSPGSPSGLIDPIAEYDHLDAPNAPETRVAVIGGYVYRGERLEGLEGRYVFGDYSGEIGTPVAGHLFYLDRSNKILELKVPSRIQGGKTELGIAVMGWGQDAHGELYVLSNDSGTLQDKANNFPGTGGVVLKLVPAEGGDD
jgi:glucose/arabinose dehydrogenase